MSIGASEERKQDEMEEAENQATLEALAEALGVDGLPVPPEALAAEEWEGQRGWKGEVERLEARFAP